MFGLTQTVWGAFSVRPVLTATASFGPPSVSCDCGSAVAMPTVRWPPRPSVSSALHARCSGRLSSEGASARLGSVGGPGGRRGTRREAEPGPVALLALPGRQLLQGAPPPLPGPSTLHQHCSSAPSALGRSQAFTAVGPWMLDLRFVVLTSAKTSALRALRSTPSACSLFLGAFPFLEPGTSSQGLREWVPARYV